MKYKTVHLGSDGGYVGFRQATLTEREQPVFGKSWVDQLEALKVDHPDWDLFQLIPKDGGNVLVAILRQSALVDPSRAQPEEDVFS